MTQGQSGVAASLRDAQVRARDAIGRGVAIDAFSALFIARRSCISPAASAIRFRMESVTKS